MALSIALGALSGIAEAQDAERAILPASLNLPIVPNSRVTDCEVGQFPEGWGCAVVTFEPGAGDRGTQYLSLLRERGWQRSGESAEYAWPFSRSADGCSQSLLLIPHLNMVTWVGFTFLVAPTQCRAEAAK